MEFQIQPLTQQFKASLTKLLDQTIGIQSDQKEKIINWKYDRPNVISYLVLDHNNVIAHYANMPLMLTYKDQKISAMLCTDMAVHPDFRRKGLITALSAKVYEQVEQQLYECSLGFSNHEGVKVDQYSRNYKYKIIGGYSLYTKILLKKQLNHNKLNQITEYSHQVSQVNDYIMIEKSIEYLNWRYKNKPGNNYTQYEISKDQIFLGYIVVKYTAMFCYVYDIITNEMNEELFKEIFLAIEEESIKKNRRIIMYNILDNKFWKQIFTRLNYFQNKILSGNTYLTIRIHKSYNKDLLDKEKWLLTNGDIL